MILLGLFISIYVLFGYLYWASRIGSFHSIYDFYLHFRLCLFIFFLVSLRIDWFSHGSKKVGHFSGNWSLFFFNIIVFTSVFIIIRTFICSTLWFFCISFCWAVFSAFCVTPVVSLMQDYYRYYEFKTIIKFN